jgi:YD repeat-containing protein
MGEWVRGFKTDSLGHLTHQKQVEATATLNDQGVRVGTPSGQWTEVFKYNAHGLLEDGYDARGTNTHFSYDTLNRLESITYTDGTPTVTYDYDEARAGFFNNSRRIKAHPYILSNFLIKKISLYERKVMDIFTLCANPFSLYARISLVSY